MQFLKLKNYIGSDGTCSYHGLDISKFVAGRQVYPPDQNECLIVTMQEDISPNPDILVITEAEYQTARETVISNLPKSPDQIRDEEIADLKAQLKLAQDAIDVLLLG